MVAGQDPANGARPAMGSIPNGPARQLDELRDVARAGRTYIEAEHREFEQLVGRIVETAGLAAQVEARDAATVLRGVLDAIETRLVPHTEWEDAFCYPRIDAVAATPWATRALREQHREIRALVGRLNEDWAALDRGSGDARLPELPARLLELAALVSSHIRQESFVLPLLDDEAEDRVGAAVGPDAPG